MRLLAVFLLTQVIYAQQASLTDINGRGFKASAAVKEVAGARGARVGDFPRYKIAIIDSGYDPTRATTKLKLCKTGHYDYLTKTSSLNYYHPHGTRVASIIAEKLKDVEYCAVIYQIYSYSDTDGIHASAVDVANAINSAIGEKVSAINMSFSGTVASPEEKQSLEWTSKIPITVFAAAGNDHQDLDKKCNAFPSCYNLKNIIVVGAQDFDEPKKHAKNSNYGKRVSIWAPGYSYDKDDDFGFGTSYAAPRALSDYILFLEHKRLARVKH